MDELLPRNKFVTEHVIFVVLLIPTFVVLGAAVFSLAQLDPSIAVQTAQAQETAACEACRGAYADDQDGP